MVELAIPISVNGRFVGNLYPDTSESEVVGEGTGLGEVRGSEWAEARVRQLLHAQKPSNRVQTYDAVFLYCGLEFHLEIKSSSLITSPKRGFFPGGYFSFCHLRGKDCMAYVLVGICSGGGQKFWVLPSSYVKANNLRQIRITACGGRSERYAAFEVSEVEVRQRLVALCWEEQGGAIELAARQQESAVLAQSRRYKEESRRLGELVWGFCAGGYLEALGYMTERGRPSLKAWAEEKWDKGELQVKYRRLVQLARIHGKYIEELKLQPAAISGLDDQKLEDAIPIVNNDSVGYWLEEAKVLGRGDFKARLLEAQGKPLPLSGYLDITQGIIVLVHPDELMTHWHLEMEDTGESPSMQAKRREAGLAWIERKLNGH